MKKILTIAVFTGCALLAVGCGGRGGPTKEADTPEQALENMQLALKAGDKDAFDDYLGWFVTILPLITGYIAFHRVGMSAPTLIAIHLLSVQLFMVVFPFTKLMHAFTIFLARWYNGAISGYRGVQS